MKYEIINPHDECYLEAPDHVTALAAVALIGEGAYGVRGNGFDSGLGMFGDFSANAYAACGIKGAPCLFDRKTGRLQTDAAFNEAVAAACDSISYPRPVTSVTHIKRMGAGIAEALRGLRTFESVEVQDA